MSPPRLLLLSLAALGAAACASTPPPAMAPAPSDAGTLQPLADHDWFVDDEDGGLQLTYGRDESDDVWLTLRCEPGSGLVGLDHYGAPAGVRQIALESGGDTETWPARTEPDELNDGVYLVAEAEAGTPVFQRFRRLGWLAAYGSDWRTPMVAQPGSIPRIERFFAACS
jgi:hypothetical protein